MTLASEQKLADLINLLEWATTDQESPAVRPLIDLTKAKTQAETLLEGDLKVKFDERLVSLQSEYDTEIASKLAGLIKETDNKELMLGAVIQTITNLKALTKAKEKI